MVGIRTVARAVLVGAALGAFAPSPASAETVTSTNWSGYAAHRGGMSFRWVSGIWRQPTPKCTPGVSTFSAAWVGIGGFRIDSQALEQIGTEADCLRSGRARQSAWWEIIPAPAASVRMTVRGGDLMQASVTVIGHRVTMRLSNLTRHTTFSKTVPVTLIDTSSAEWIVETPSVCYFDGSCRTLPLANFVSVPFTNAFAMTTRKATGRVVSPLWDTTTLTLVPSPRALTDTRVVGTATPSALLGGSAFAVSFKLTKPAVGTISRTRYFAR